MNASWQANEQGIDTGAGKSSIYSQRYNLQWYPRITHAISLNANMNYFTSWATERGMRESITPTLNVQVQNDLFLMEFNGQANETNREDSRDQRNYTWETMLGSSWEYVYWPTLSFIIGQNRDTDTEDIHRVDNDREWYEFIAGWEWKSLETYYSYYAQTRTDHVERSTYDDARHFGRIDYSREFLANRGRFSITQQITDSVTDFSAETDAGGRVDIAVNLSQGLAGIDPTPERGTLPVNNGLIDGNRNTPAYIINLQERANLGIKTDLQRVDKIYLYTGSQDAQFINDAGNLRWDLYASRDGSEWQRFRVNPGTHYNSDEFRYEVDVTGTENIYLKLVVTGWPLTVPVPITEIQAFRTREGTGGQVDEKQTYTKYLTDFNASYSPTVSTRAFYSLVWDTEENNTGNERDRLFQSANFRWIMNKYFIPTFTFNNTTVTNTETEDTKDRSYGVSIRSTPLPALDSTFSLTRNESYEDDNLLNSSHVLNMLTSATLYPNLDSTLDLNLIFTENEETNVSSDAFGIRWILTGRLRPDFLADLIVEYGKNTTDLSEFTSIDDSGGRTTVNINYRPSEWLSLLLNASRGYGESWENYNAVYFDVNFAVLRTNKTQFNLGYRINADEDETVNNFNCNLGWRISEFLTFQTIGNYLITDEENIWSINARLTARY